MILRKAARQLASDYSPPPWPPRLLQFRLEPCPISVHFGVTVGHAPQFIEHHGYIPRYADLVGPSPNVGAAVT